MLLVFLPLHRPKLLVDPRRFMCCLPRAVCPISLFPLSETMRLICVLLRLLNNYCGSNVYKFPEWQLQAFLFRPCFNLSRSLLWFLLFPFFFLSPSFCLHAWARLERVEPIAPQYKVCFSPIPGGVSLIRPRGICRIGL